MLFAPIGFTTVKGSWNIMFLSDVKYPRILYAILFLYFGCGVEKKKKRLNTEKKLKFYGLIE